MFEYLQGTLEEKSQNYTIVDVGGIGYKCLTPLSTYSELPHLGEKIKLFLSHIVREDAEILFGFYSKHERDLFQMLITISGVGPKTALALVGNLGLSTLNLAIQEENDRIIAKVPGIGKKTASRIIVEMKDKLNALEKMKIDAHLEDIDTLSLDAINALVNLGYASHKAKTAVKKLRKDHESLNTLIPSALQII